MSDESNLKPHHIAAYLLLLILLIFSSITSFKSYKKLNTPTPTQTPTPTTSNSISENSNSTDINSLKAEIAKLRSEQTQLKMVLSASSSSASVSDYLKDTKNLLQIANNRFPSIDVHELPLASAKIIGSLKINKSYPFTSKQSNWYQVQLEDGQFGWVQQDLVSEL